MLIAIREVRIATRRLKSAIETYQRVLGLAFGGIERGLEPHTVSASMLAGSGTRLTLVEPENTQSPAGEALASTRGEGAYLVGFEESDVPGLRTRLEAHGGFTLTELKDYSAVRCLPQKAPGLVMEFWPRKEPDLTSGHAATQADASNPSTIRQIRQVGMLVRDLNKAVLDWSELFGVKPTRNHHRLPWSAIEVAVLPLGGKATFIELVQPTDESGPPARRLAEVGEGPWLVILEVRSFDQAHDRVRSSGIRIGRTSDELEGHASDLRSLWIHPRSFCGAFIQLSQVLTPDNPWPLAGDQWWEKV